MGRWFKLVFKLSPSLQVGEPLGYYSARPSGQLPVRVHHSATGSLGAVTTRRGQCAGTETVLLSGLPVDAGHPRLIDRRLLLP
jgi:hypothetical protein